MYIACGRDVAAIPLRAHAGTPGHGHSHTHADASKTCEMHVLHAHTSVDSNAGILTIHISKCRTLLIAGYDDKSIVSWDLTANSGQVAGIFKLRKKPQNITTATYNAPSNNGVYSSVVLVSDKFGEVYALNMDLTKAVMITGHSTSVITDMLCCAAGNITAPLITTTASTSSSGSGSPSNLTADNLLITSDRDEKIRVSFFPAAHVIHTYCLHHRYVICDV